jgi:hypothetical protein
LLGRTVGFQRLVQPAAPLCVAVAVAEEGPVLGRVQDTVFNGESSRPRCKF